jgi:carboxyl-terminal processing protease
MKKIIAFAYLLSLSMAAQNHEKACDIFSKVNSVLQERHIQPKPIDDSLSVYVFETVMDGLDDNRTIFLKEDADLLSMHKYKIDDYIRDKQCAFFNDFIATYKKALERNKGYIEEISKGALTFYTNDTIVYSRQVFPYHKDPARIKKYLRKKIAYDIFEDIAKLSTNKDSLRNQLGALGPAAKARIIDAHMCRINALINPAQGFEASMYSKFFSAFCTYFDPHSEYFNYNDKASFMSSIATENYSLGLYVSQNEKEEIVVEDVVPGGPAYKTKKIAKGDKLLKLAANNQEYTVSCASLETIGNIVLSDTYRNVELTFRKNDGTVYSVDLEKKIMKAEDHSVYSFVLGDTTPVGYIKIPSFYTELDDFGTRGCADDVAKELAKLKKDNIKSLIIDLQYNGGGSMDEVIRLASMFIDSGPVALIAGKNGSVNVIKDYYRGTSYNGPLVVLVNGFSASASEFFAGVMQDYNRALIAGSATLGKATMQTILPLKGSEEDFVKVTIDKFYRVTGKSSQYTGIEPDSKMPVYFDEFLPKESTMPMAIKNDSIDVQLKLRKAPADAIKKAAALSRNRTGQSDDFNRIKGMNTKISALYKIEKPAMAVTFDNVFDDVHSMDAIWKEINEAAEKEFTIKVSNTGGASKLAPADDFQQNINEQKIKALKADAYINEALQIATDLYNLKAGK